MNQISVVRVLAIITCALAFIGSDVAAQEARTDDGAWTAAYAWLKANGRIPDTTRVVRDSAEMWKRFVVCGGPADRPCTMRDNRYVTMVTVRRISADTARIGVSQYFLRTSFCTGSDPVVTARIATTAWTVYTFVNVNGKWEQRTSSMQQC